MKQVAGLDQFDLEAMRDSRAIRTFHREFALERPATKAQAKRGVLRGSLGAKDRKGLKAVSR